MNKGLPALSRVLVVDDNPFTRQTLTIMVRRVGRADVDGAADGETALAMVTSDRPDLVICDVRMSPMDGFAFLEKLRQHADVERRSTRVIMLTADPTEETAEKARLLNPDAYILKPISAIQLASVLQTMFAFAPPA